MEPKARTVTHRALLASLANADIAHGHKGLHGRKVIYFFKNL